MLRRRIEQLERDREAGAEFVPVVIMGAEDEAGRIAEECARRGVAPDRAFLAIVRVSPAAGEVGQACRVLLK